MLLEHTDYHKLLRVAMVVVAFVLLFDSGMVAPATAVLSENTQSYLSAAVGVGASVRPTEVNQITAELTAQRQALDEREAVLAQREIEVGLAESSPTANFDYSTYVLASILFILLVLIVLNYTLDYLRVREQEDLSPAQV